MAISVISHYKRHSFLRTDFNRMEINFSFLRTFLCDTQWLFRILDHSVEIKWMCGKYLISLYLKRFFL